MSKRNFETMLEEGKEYEKVVQAYFESYGYKIDDKSDDEEYQQKDIDFIAYQGKRSYKVEVKADSRMHETGNIVIEDGMIRSVGYRPGWLHKCEADVLCFVDVVGKVAYMLDWKKIRQNIDKYGKRIEFQNKYDNCIGIIYLLSVENAFKHDLVFQKIAI
jgi:Holliday junction resolvase-like predicted endonuclease